MHDLSSGLDPGQGPLRVPAGLATLAPCPVGRRARRQGLVEPQTSPFSAASSQSGAATLGDLAGRMSRFDDERSLVLASAAAIPGWESRALTAEPAIPILASPSWRGVDGTPWRVKDRRSGESLFVKAMDPDSAFYIDVPTTFLAARRASDLGVGPRVLAADEATGVLVMEDLDNGWRVGTLERLLDP